MNKKILPILLALLLGGCTRNITESIAEEPPGVLHVEESTAKEYFYPVISEAMSKNRTVPIEGKLPDWVELANPYSTPVSLNGLYLSKNIDKPKACALPDMTIQPGEYLLLTEEKLGFRLSKNGEEIYLFDAEGKQIDCMSVPSLHGNESFTKEFGIVDYPSPGMANLPENKGGSFFPCELVISEVCTVNDMGLQTFPPDYSDWVELYNAGNEEIDLSHFFLSDDADELKLFPLGPGSLSPGEYLLLSLNPDAGAFSLSSAGETIYLTNADGLICDLLTIPFIPADCSYGREDGRELFYAHPTPGKANAGGYESMCVEPVISVASGWYNTPFEVSISGSGEIHYTTDGSLPMTYSNLYTGEPIRVDQSMSLRARSFEGDRIPSETVTVNYFFNEIPLTLDVVKISMRPIDAAVSISQFSSVKAPASIALYVNGEEQFSESCGISVQGSGSRIYEKLSYQIDFRSRYGKPSLHYKLFDKLEQDEFTTITLRSGSQDQCAACMRDEIISDIFFDCSDSLLTFCYRPVNLYLNEEYRGVYFIRERCKPSTVAYRFGVKEKGVTMIRFIDERRQDNSPEAEFTKLMDYIRTHDMGDQNCFDTVEEKLNIDGLIDFYVALIWSNNFDSNNIRFFRSEADNGRWQLILYDSDVAFYLSNALWVHNVLYLYSGMLNNFLNNYGFKEKLTLRMGELFRTALDEDRVIARIDALESIMDHDMVYNGRRYPLLSAYEEWKRSVEAFRSRVGFGVRGNNKSIIEQYIQEVELPEELIREAFGEEFVLNYS